MTGRGQVRCAVGKVIGQLARRIHVAEQDAGEGLRAALPRVPGGQHRADAGQPGHGLGARTLEHDDGAGVRGGHGTDERLLVRGRTSGARGR